MIAAAIPCGAIFWLSYDYAKYFLRRTHFLEGWLSTPMLNLIAASFAEVTQNVVRTPFEVVK